jgi:hypothetical protein
VSAATFTNIDRFNLTALKLFEKLYDEFPNPRDIDTKELGISASPDDAEFIEAFKFTVYAQNAVSWLAEEGFIRYEQHESGTTFRRVRLTLKGLTVLGYIPTAVRGREKPVTLISRVKKVLAGGAEKAGTEAVRTIITELFKLAASPSSAHGASSFLQA